MTISSTLARNDYSGSTSLGPYVFGFKIYAATDLQVIKRATTAVETVLTYLTDYTVAGTGNDAGGSITLLAAPLTSDIITIRRNLPLTQDASLRNQGSYLPETIEDQLDKAVALTTQLQDALDRSLKLPASYNPTGRLRELVPTAGKVVVGDGTGFTTATLDSSATALPGNNRTVASVSAFLANNTVFNVKDYGALGDGATDDTAAFNRAITAARAARGKVRVPGSATDYKITSTLVLGSATLTFVPLEGDGANDTTPTTRIAGTFAGPLVRISGTGSSTFSLTAGIRDLNLKQSHASGSCIEANYTSALILDTIYMEMPGGGTGITSGTFGISAEFHAVYIYGAAGSTGISGSWYNLKIFGGRIYHCDYALDCYPGCESILAVGLNAEFNRVFFRHGALNTALFVGCHVETTDVLLTNAYTVPISAATGTAWAASAGAGTGAALLGGSVKFLGCRFLLQRLDTDHVVIQSEAFFSYRLSFDGCACTPTAIRFSSSFLYNSNVALPTGTTLELHDISPTPQYTMPSDAFSKTRAETARAFTMTEFALPSGTVKISDATDAASGNAKLMAMHEAAGKVAFQLSPVAGLPSGSYDNLGNIICESTRGPLFWSGGTYHAGVRMFASAVPTSGTWVATDEVWNTAPGPGLPLLWRCTTGGTPGTWATIRAPGLTATIGDAAFVVAVQTTAPTIRAATPLTANRAITLPAAVAGAYHGLAYHVVRTAASTGAFTLDVGGLKSLAVSQWCDVAFDGTSWILTAFGSL